MSPIVRRFRLVVFSLLVTGLVIQPIRSIGVSAAISSAPTARQTCKTVKKHGKKHRVCKPVKGHHSPTPTPAPSPTPSPTPTPPAYDAQAQTLVDGYVAATSDDGRLHALEAIMAALHVTVYGPNATPVVQGAGTKNDPFFVEVQLRDMAASEQAGATTTLDDLAHDLAIAGVHNADNIPLSADALAKSIETGIQQAISKPSDPTSLAPLLIRQLGLRQKPSVDLATGVPVAQIKLDALQRYLLSADILIPWALSTSAMAASVHAAILHGDIVSQQSGISWLFGGGPYPPSPVEQEVQKLLPSGPPPTLETVAEWLKTQWLKTFHFDIHPVIEEPLASHYGPVHDGDEGLGGHAITFKLNATLAKTATSGVADCVSELALVQSANICTLDTLSETQVTWDLSSIKPYSSRFDPDPNGIVVGSYAPVVGSSATVLYLPKQEFLPGIGVEKTATGVVTASPKVAERIGGLDPKLSAMLDAEYANQQFPWKVTYHEPRGFKFNVHEQWHFSAPHFSQTTDDYITAHVCGPNPFGVPWTWKVHDVVTNNVDGATSYDFVDPTVPLQFDAISVGNGQGNGHVNDLGFGIFVWSGIPFGGHANPGGSTAQGDVIFDRSPPAMLRISITGLQNPLATNFTIDTTSQHLAVPIEEDTSCSP